MACENYTPCPKKAITKPRKHLTVLLLDCWQREYDKRPYRNFKLNKLDFEERMGRPFDTIKDLGVILEFLKERLICSFSITGIDILCYKENMIKDLVAIFFPPFKKIELHSMTLPRVFFDTLFRNMSKLFVKELSFAGTLLTDEDVKDVRKCLIISKRLTYLNLAYCNITQFNWPLIADGIHKSNSMRRLNCTRIIGGHTLYLDTQKVATILAQLIWLNRLEEIVMRECEFSGHDMETIAEYISMRHSVLTSLDLAANKIGPDGAEHLFRAIAKSGRMKSLNISSNSIGLHGGNVIAKYLSSCFLLQYLYITNNDIPRQQMNLILTTMKKPMKLLRLEVYGNRFDARSAMILRRLLDARVVPQDTIDISVTFDEALNDYRIIPWRE